MSIWMHGCMLGWVDRWLELISGWVGELMDG